MNESYFESMSAIFDEKSPFLSIFDTFWANIELNQFGYRPQLVPGESNSE